MKHTALDSSEYHTYYKPYIELVGDLDLSVALKNGLASFKSLSAIIPDSQLQYSYAEGKWSVAEALVHLIDTERIFQYRALRFARNDKTNLPGFDQDFYVPASNANLRSKDAIVEEFLAVRMATITLFNSFNEQELLRIGVASDSHMSVRALGFIICGHLKHHIALLKNHYL